MKSRTRSRTRTILLWCIYLAIVAGFAELFYLICNGSCVGPSAHTLILNPDGYADNHLTGVWEILRFRVMDQPFNLVALIIFVCAVTHTLFSYRINALADKLHARHAAEHTPVETFGVEILRFMGEVEVIFGIWVIPLLLSLGYFYDWQTAVHYLDTRDYTEPLFVVVIMALASTNPILKLAEDGMRFVARLGGQSVKAWWWAIMTLGPLAGSFVTEPGAMTISALLLAKRFYRLNPSPAFAYATLGLLFTNISVGGVLTSFAAPPVLMVAKSWGWDTPYMFTHFGSKAVVGILIANLVYYLYFRKEFSALEERNTTAPPPEGEASSEKIPLWISLFHVIFLAWTVVHSHHPVMFIGSFLLFLGFYKATRPFQGVFSLKTPVLVGFFLAGLVVHGSLQAWWIAPIFESASREALMGLSIALTAFNDNAEITFLATLIPSFDEAMKYFVVAGAVTGGGLTVIANAPNPSGQAILNPFFEHGVSPLRLFLGAALPTAIMAASFYFLYAG